MSFRTAVRRAASGCGCNGARIASRAIARPVLASRAVPAMSIPAIRAFTTSSPVLKQARDAWAKDPVIGYDQVKEYSERPSDNVLLVDVRDPEEVELGSIPGSVNLPLPRLDDALNQNFSPGAFQNEFAFAKPLPKQNIVFFCRSGKRSATACEFAEANGYPNVRNYVGSMLDWAEHEGLDPESLGL